MLSNINRWIWMVLVICAALGIAAMASGVFPLVEPQRTNEIVAVPPSCPNQALYLILGAALIVIVIFGAVILRGRGNHS